MRIFGKLIKWDREEGTIWLQYAHERVPSAIAHSCISVCVCNVWGWVGVPTARLTAVEWHINEYTACNLHYKAQPLTWRPFIPTPPFEITFLLLYSFHTCQCHKASCVNRFSSIFSLRSLFYKEWQALCPCARLLVPPNTVVFNLRIFMKLNTESMYL